MICGALAVRFYTSHLAKWLIGELVSGLTLGSFVVIGCSLCADQFYDPGHHLHFPRAGDTDRAVAFFE